MAGYTKNTDSTDLLCVYLGGIVELTTIVLNEDEVQWLAFALGSHEQRLRESFLETAKGDQALADDLSQHGLRDIEQLWRHLPSWTRRYRPDA
jgi:hypothetical protein